MISALSLSLSTPKLPISLSRDSFLSHSLPPRAAVSNEGVWWLYIGEWGKDGYGDGPVLSEIYVYTTFYP